VHWASRANLELLLRAGVRVYLYEKGFVHAKTVVTDEDLCSVGTCNMDVRSLEINFEDQLFIYDKELSGRFAEQFLKDLESACELSLTDWLKRPVWQKFLESFGRLYSAQI
jgi:cardiolipin synthase